MSKYQNISDKCHLLCHRKSESTGESWERIPTLPPKTWDSSPFLSLSFLIYKHRAAL